MAHKVIGESNLKTGRKQPKAEPIRRLAKVAIFEDNPTVCLAYCEMLSSCARVVNSQPIETVEEAIAIFIREMPDVVITDLSLSEKGMEGFEILRRIRKISPSTPVGLSTACYNPKKDDEINIEIRKQGFDALFQKADILRMSEFVEASAPES